MLIIMGFLCICAGAAIAGPPVFVPSNPDSIPVGVPVDGGASLLLIAGGSYAFKKLKKKRV